MRMLKVANPAYEALEAEPGPIRLHTARREWFKEWGKEARRMVDKQARKCRQEPLTGSGELQ